LSLQIETETPVTAPAPKNSKPRLGRLFLWLTLLAALVVWGATQPPTRLEPLPLIGVLDI
jgi:hypothetical protein